MNETTNFIIVGAQRSGSTFLYQMLCEHPEICMAGPVRPEPKYFLADPSSLSAADYEQKYFAARRPVQHALGEKSTSYYESETAAQSIKQILPAAKIIFILRNPSERAISNYYFSFNNGIESRSITQVFIEKTAAPEFDRNHISVNPFDYIHRSEYYKFVAIYQRLFPAQQIFFCTLENLLQVPTELQRLADFIGLKNSFTGALINEAVNSSERPKSENIKVTETLDNYFLPYNRTLETMTNLDLSCWQR
jgi:hypothetical protein